MTHRVAISALYGKYDSQKIAPVGVDESVLFTDTANPVTGWSRAVRTVNPSIPARYRSKIPKMVPHRLGIDTNDVLWVDASMQPTGKSVESLFNLVPEGGVGMFVHPDRGCIYDEASVCIVQARHATEDVVRQAQFYRETGHPEHSGLWASGIVVWRGAQRILGAPWLAETFAWSSSCQVSLPYIARSMGIKITDIGSRAKGDNVYGNQWFTFVDHACPTEIIPVSQNRLQEVWQMPSDQLIFQTVDLRLAYEHANGAIDIGEHIPRLRDLASRVDRVTEFGVRTGASTMAFLYAGPKSLLSVDINDCPDVSRLRLDGDSTKFTFRQADTRETEIPETDLLFIDTLHTFDQLRVELARHSPKVAQKIVLHDTVTFGETGEDGTTPGLWQAVVDFVADGTWRIEEHRMNNNGLTVLQRT